MPGKLKVLVALLALSAVMALVGQNWLSLIINALLIVGILKGSEGARTFLMLLATLGLLGAAFIFFTGMMAGAVGASGAVIVLAGAGFTALVNGFMLWCLRQGDVQHWMFKRSSGGLG